MTRHHFSLWLLLAVAFVIFAVASAVGLPEVYGHQLKSAQISDNIFSPRQEDSPLAADTASLDTTVIEGPTFPVPVDTAAQRILFIGDSMLEGLGPRLAAYARKNGHILYNVVWYSSTSEVWGRSDKLSRYIEQIRPTFIFVSLGANELFVTDIKNKRRQYVEKIISDIDTIPYLWIGPPNWKPDTGINDLIAESTPQGAFFLSNGMHFDRARDGAHPTRASAIEWMDSVMRWMPEHSFHPICMELPEVATARPARVFVHQPNER